MISKEEAKNLAEKSAKVKNTDAVNKKLALIEEKIIAASNRGIFTVSSFFEDDSIISECNCILRNSGYDTKVMIKDTEEIGYYIIISWK